MGNVAVLILAKTMISRVLEASLWHLAGLVVLLILLVVIVVSIKGWLRDDDDLANADQEMLREIAELQRRGALSEEEYRSIKGRIAERLNLPANGARHETREGQTPESREGR